MGVVTIFDKNRFLAIVLVSGLHLMSRLQDGSDSPSPNDATIGGYSP